MKALTAALCISLLLLACSEKSSKDQADDLSAAADATDNGEDQALADQVSDQGQVEDQEQVDQVEDQEEISPCPDEDQDGVCDEEDKCPKGDDHLDADQDQVPDACDRCPQGDDRIDMDGDGIPNACETECHSEEDTDGDLVPDDCDRCLEGDDHLDTDEDTIPDACDLCSQGDDLQDLDQDGTPDHCDTDKDNDGVLDMEDLDPTKATVCRDQDQDGCDDCTIGVDGFGPQIDALPENDGVDSDGDGACDEGDPCPEDADNDEDQDGLCAGEDNCPQVENLAQEDEDEDGIGDACDLCPLDPEDDNDNDGHCADQDNCPLQSNADQANSDGDNMGDACDRCPADPLNDADGDTICGDLDNCPMVANPAQQDSDQDGQGDPCDDFPLGAEVPSSGLIVMWSGELQEVDGYWHPVVDGVPDMRWYRCDGSVVDGFTLPDLRDRFVVGANDASEIGQTGGRSFVTLTTANLPPHQHEIYRTLYSNDADHKHFWDDRINDLWKIYVASGPGLYGGDSEWSAEDRTSYAGGHTHALNGDTFETGASAPFEILPEHVVLTFIMALPEEGAVVEGLGETTFPLPQGAISLWAGDLAELGGVYHPSLESSPDIRWSFCDGADDTPDLRGKFARGASSFSIGLERGANEITLSLYTLPEHRHGVPDTEEADFSHVHTIPEDDFAIASGNNAIIAGSNTDWGNYVDGRTESRETSIEGGGHTHFAHGDTTFVGEGVPFDIRPPYLSLAYLEDRGSLAVMPKGSIVLWDGEMSNGHPVIDGVVDTRWEVCDGDGGLPDLTSAFARGQSASNENGDEGGVFQFYLQEEHLPTHTHGLNVTVDSGGSHDHWDRDSLIRKSYTVFLGFAGFPVGIDSTWDHRETQTEPAGGLHSHSVGDTFTEGEGLPIELAPESRDLVFLICVG